MLFVIVCIVCEQCCLCIDLCFWYLIGYEFFFYLLVWVVNYCQVVILLLLFSVLICLECNVCESVVCLVGIFFMCINCLLKCELRVKNLCYDGLLCLVDEMVKYCLVLVKWFISKLGFDFWYQEVLLMVVELEVVCVILFLCQYIGISVVFCVVLGEWVMCGQVLVDIFVDVFGVLVYVSIDGLVFIIMEQVIMFVRG